MRMEKITQSGASFFVYLTQNNCNKRFKEDEIDRASRTHGNDNKLIQNICPKKIASVVEWSGFLATDLEVRVRFPALPDFLRCSGSGTGSTQPREYN
jgi:hypothetical protein